MAYFINGYPYSDTHNLNLDWVIDTLKRIETEMGQLHDGLEIHVTGNDGTEIYTFTVKANGVYITRPDGGTPFFYNFDTQTLYSSKFDGQQFLTASGRTTGQFRAGSLVLDNALPIAQGGTGSTNAAGARNALGAMASDAVIPISQGGTGATTAAAARTALGAEAAFNVLPVDKGGTGVTGIVTGTLESANTNVTIDPETKLRKWGRVVSLTFKITLSATVNAYTTLFNLPDGFKPIDVYNTFIRSDASDTIYKSYTYSSGGYTCRSTLQAGTYYGELTILI